MKPEAKAEGERWLRQAKHDLDDAHYAQEGQRFHLVCFLAQQAAEKAVKAFLYSRGLERAWGHSVAELVRAAADLDEGFRALTAIGGNLDRHYIPTRYPNGLPGGIPAEAFDAEDAHKALGQARQIIALVDDRLREPAGQAETDARDEGDETAPDTGKPDEGQAAK